MSDTDLTTKPNVRAYLTSQEVQERVKQLLDKRAAQFTTSIMAVLNSNPKLQECTPATVLGAAINAAALDLPITPSLGFACIVPFWNSKKRVFEAQFQIMLKGLVQLSHRSREYKSIAAAEVYEGQLVKIHPLDGPVFDWENKLSDTVIGYVSRFRLLNGFESTLYMSLDEVEAHGARYSKSYQQDKKNNWNTSLWSSDFKVMALKTVLKLNLARNGYLSTDMQQAIGTDQAVIEGDAVEYHDNDTRIEAPKMTEVDKAEVSTEADDLADSLISEVENAPTIVDANSVK